MEAELSAQRQQVYILEKNAEQDRRLLVQMEDDAKTQEDKIASLLRELDRSQTDGSDSGLQLVKERKKTEQLEKELQEVTMQRNDFEDELEDLRPQVRKLQTQVDAMTKQREDLKRLHSEANDKAIKNQELANVHGLKFSEQQKSNATLNKIVKKQDTNIEELNNKIKVSIFFVYLS